MNTRERFDGVMGYKDRDRIPVWYFGQWNETTQRWEKEEPGSTGNLPAFTGMDPDWEKGMWNIHGMVNVWAISPEPTVVLEETEHYRVVRTSLGAILKESKQGSSIPQHVEEALKPTRASWETFKKYIDPADPRRRADGWERTADTLNSRKDVATFLGGQLYSAPREWMGVEALSMLSYDDPVLYEEIIDYITESFIILLKPVLQRVQFDFAYFFEDCCFNTGPLFSPHTYRRFYQKYYRRLTDFYHSMGVKYVLLDSDGKVDDLVQCWMDSGIDIIFPVEVGTWQADPRQFRKKFGRNLRMMGGVDKHVIPKGRDAVRKHLEPLVPLVKEGGYIPFPDHRIPPDCSLQQFRDYVEVFKEVFE